MARGKTKKVSTVVANRLATPNSRLAIPSELSVKLGRIGRWLGKNGGGQSTEFLVHNLPIHSFLLWYYDLEQIYNANLDPELVISNPSVGLFSYKLHIKKL